MIIERLWIGQVSIGIEALAVVVIFVALAHGLFRYLIHVRRGTANAYEQLKNQIGKGLLLGLDFLVAADIIRTIALEPSLGTVLTLGLLVLIRTFLSWSLVVEMDSRWPWQPSSKR